MSTTLTYGQKLPETDDTGDSWFSDLEDDITAIDAHFHDGVTSKRTRAMRQTISSGSYTTATTSTRLGMFYKDITLSLDSSAVLDGLTLDNIAIQFRVSSTNEVAYLEFQQLTSTSYRLYVNDPNETYVAIYTS